MEMTRELALEMIETIDDAIDALVQVEVDITGFEPWRGTFENAMSCTEKFVREKQVELKAQLQKYADACELTGMNKPSTLLTYEDYGLVA